MIDCSIRLLYELEHSLLSTILAWNFQHISYNSISPGDLYYLSAFLEGFDTFRERVEIPRLDLT